MPVCYSLVLPPGVGTERAQLTDPPRNSCLLLPPTPRAHACLLQPATAMAHRPHTQLSACFCLLLPPTPRAQACLLLPATATAHRPHVHACQLLPATATLKRHVLCPYPSSYCLLPPAYLFLPTCYSLLHPAPCTPPHPPSCSRYTCTCSASRRAAWRAGCTCQGTSCSMSLHPAQR